MRDGITSKMAVVMVLLSMAAVMNCEVQSSPEMESILQPQASEAAKPDDSFEKWWGSVDTTAGKTTVANKQKQETEFVETQFRPAVVGRFTRFTKTRAPEDLLHNRELEHLPANEKPKHVKKKAAKAAPPQKTVLGFVLKKPHKAKVVKQAHLPVAMSSIIGKTEGGKTVLKVVKKKLSLAQKRSRANKIHQAKKKAWIKSRLSSVLGSLKSAGKDAKKPAKRHPTAAPYHKHVQVETMLQKLDALHRTHEDAAERQLDEEVDDDDEEEEDELDQLGSLESLQRRKKKMLADGTLLSKAVQKEDAKAESTHALAIMHASLQAAKDYNERHLHPGKLLAIKKAKEARAKKRVADKKLKKLQERKYLFNELSKTFIEKKTKKVKKTQKKVKVAKKPVKKAKKVQMLSTNLFSSEVTEEKKKNTDTEPDAVEDFLGDIGVQPKRVYTPPPVPEGTPNPAFVSDTMASLISGDEDEHKEDTEESSKPIVGSLHVSHSHHTVAAKVQPTATLKTKASPKKKVASPKITKKTKAAKPMTSPAAMSPKPVLGSTAALIASLKKAGMAKEAAELEKTANGGIAGLAESHKKPTKVKKAPQPKALVEPIQTEDVLVEQLKAAGMTEQAGVLAEQLKKVQH